MKKNLSGAVDHRQPHLVFCSGFHPPRLTERFVQVLSRQLRKVDGQQICQPCTVVPVAEPFKPHLVSHALTDDRTRPPLLLIGFSAGVVGAIAVAQQWQWQGGKVAAVIAVDGWGVPRWGGWPSHRVSHDYFTHWSSACLGGGLESFYADPPVGHLNLWECPEQVQGWRVGASTAVRSSAVTAIADWLHYYGCGNALQSLPGRLIN
jgi:hypothetical protein